MRSDRSGSRRRLNRPTMLVVGEDHPVDLKIFSHVPYPMSVLQTRQSGGRESLQRLRRRIAPSTAPCTLPALRCGGPGKSDGLLLVPWRVAGAQASPALSRDRRHGSSRGDCCPWVLHLPPRFACRRAFGAGREQRGERSRSSRRRGLHRPGCGGRRYGISWGRRPARNPAAPAIRDPCEASRDHASPGDRGG